MKKAIKLSVLLVLFIGLTAMSAHRFYVGIYQVDFVPQKNDWKSQPVFLWMI